VAQNTAVVRTHDRRPVATHRQFVTARLSSPFRKLVRLRSTTMSVPRPVVDDSGRLVGIVSADTLIHVVLPRSAV
jgi:CBS domain-containing protein